MTKQEILNQFRDINVMYNDSSKFDALSRMLDELINQKPVEPEMEGGGSWWYPVCGECHGMIIDKYKYCPHCGREINWSNN